MTLPPAPNTRARHSVVHPSLELVLYVARSAPRTAAVSQAQGCSYIPIHTSTCSLPCSVTLHLGTVSCHASLPIPFPLPSNPLSICHILFPPPPYPTIRYVRVYLPGTVSCGLSTARPVYRSPRTSPPSRVSSALGSCPPVSQALRDPASNRPQVPFGAGSIYPDIARYFT